MGQFQHKPRIKSYTSLIELVGNKNASQAKMLSEYSAVQIYIFDLESQSARYHNIPCEL